MTPTFPLNADIASVSVLVPKVKTAGFDAACAKRAATGCSGNKVAGWLDEALLDARFPGLGNLWDFIADVADGSDTRAYEPNMPGS